MSLKYEKKLKLTIEISDWIKKQHIKFFKKMRARARGGNFFFLGTNKMYTKKIFLSCPESKQKNSSLIYEEN